MGLFKATAAVAPILNEAARNEGISRMEIQLQLFFTSELDGGEWLNLPPRRFSL